MKHRHMLSFVAIALTALVLAACGSESEVVAPTTAPVSTRITASSGDVVQAATPATIAPTSTAKVVASTNTTPSATSVAAKATPVASMQATPAVTITGTLTLEGRAQQDYTMSTEGCLGLGEWRSLKPGTQVIVRNAAGTVIEISSLTKGSAGDACSWTFTLAAPDSEFFSVSIPMITEVWFTPADIADGNIELIVP